jgi:hypothetical protein
MLCFVRGWGLPALGLLAVLASMGEAAAREYKAVVYVKRPEMIGAALPFVEVYKPRINQEKQVVLGSAMRHNRSQYSKQTRVDLERIHSMGWSHRQGMMQVEMTDGTRRDYYCYPANAKPPRDDAWIESSAMEAARLTGQFVVQGRKVKTELPLGQIKKVYFVDESVSLDAIAYEWAREENSIDGWKEFRRLFPESAQASAANESLVRLLLRASEDSLKRFRDGGTLADLRKAKALAEEALRNRSGEAGALELKKAATEAEQDVYARVEGMGALEAQRKWDQALEAHSQIARFAPEIPQIAELERQALQGSHDVHRQAAQEHVKAGRLEQGIAEYQTALGRLENAETRAELRETSIQLALQRAEKARAVQDLQGANEILKQAIEQQGSDPRLEKLNAAVKIQWADRLVKQAAPFYMMPRIDSDGAEQKHLKALAYLEQANSLIPRPETEKAAREIRRRLAARYFQLGQKKLALARGTAVGQARLYLLRAESYDNELPGLAEALERAREAFHNKSSVGVNIALTDKSLSKECSHIAGEIEGYIGQEITQAGLRNVQVVEREEFERLKKEQAITQTHSETELTLNVQGASVQVLGDILVCEVKALQRTSGLPSQYISGYRENPEYYRLVQERDRYSSQAQAIDQQDDAYKACAEQERRANVYGQCRYARDQYKREYDRLRNLEYQANSVLQNTPAQFPIITAYSYTRRDITVQGRIKVGYRIVDSLSSIRRQQEQLTAEDTKSGTEIRGAMANDTKGITDREANVPSEDEMRDQLVRSLQKKIAEAIVAFLRNFGEKYIERARQARDRGALDDAIENYILFLATTAEKGGPNCQEAEGFLSEKRNLVYRPE